MERDNGQVLTKAESHLALLGYIYNIKFKDRNIARKLYHTRWSYTYDPEIGVDPSVILDNPEISRSLVSSVRTILDPNLFPIRSRDIKVGSRQD